LLIYFISNPSVICDTIGVIITGSIVAIALRSKTEITWILFTMRKLNLLGITPFYHILRKLSIVLILDLLSLIINIWILLLNYVIHKN